MAFSDEFEEAIEEDAEAAPEEESDPLADLDEETRGKAEQAVARGTREVEAKFSAVRESLRQYGFDLSEDGTPVIRDPKTVRSLFGAEERPAAAVVPAPEEEDENALIPDQMLDPRGHREWIGKQVQRETAQQRAHIERLERLLVSREADAAVGRAERALEQMRPDLAHLTDHPDFAGAFQQVLQTVPPEQWQDPRNLARLALMVVPDLDPARNRAKPARTNDGRFAEQLTRAQRSSAAQVAPSRDGGRAPRPAEYTDMERLAAERLGISPAEARALKEDPTGVAYLAARKKRTG